MPTYKQDMTATSGNMGGDKENYPLKDERKAYKADKKKYKKEQKNAKKVFKETGFKSYGDPFGPKKSDYKKESAKQERKNLLTENPVVNRSDDNENIGRGGKGPKPMSKVRRAKASVMKLKDGLVSRFQGSTPKIGKNELMKPVIESLTPSVAGQAMLKATIKKPIAISYDAFNKAQQSADPMPKTSSQKKKK